MDARFNEFGVGHSQGRPEQEQGYQSAEILSAAGLIALNYNDFRHSRMYSYGGPGSLPRLSSRPERGYFLGRASGAAGLLERPQAICSA